MENGICNGEAMLPFLYASAMLIALCVTFVFILPKLIRTTLPYKDDFALEKLYNNETTTPLAKKNFAFSAFTSIRSYRCMCMDMGIFMVYRSCPQKIFLRECP